jgi:hypothetical protein
MTILYEEILDSTEIDGMCSRVLATKLSFAARGCYFMRKFRTGKKEFSDPLLMHNLMFHGMRLGYDIRFLYMDKHTPEEHSHTTLVEDTLAKLEKHNVKPQKVSVFHDHISYNTLKFYRNSLFHLKRQLIFYSRTYDMEAFFSEEVKEKAYDKEFYEFALP